MKWARPVITVLGISLLLGVGMLFLLPIESGDCPQIYEEFYRRDHDPALIQGTLWTCFSAIRGVNARAADEVRLEKVRAVHQAEVQAAQRVAEEKAAAEKAKADRIQAENEQGLVPPYRARLCPLLASNGPGTVTLRLLSAKGELFLYHLSADCPDCRYIQPPTWTFERLDGTRFCEGGGMSGGDCPAKLKELTVLLEATHHGTLEQLRQWLGC